MIGARVLHAGDSETGRPRAQAEIDVLEREKVRLVQQANLLEDLAPDDHHAPADRIDRANGIGTESGNTRAGGPVAHPPGSLGERNARRRHVVRLLARLQHGCRDTERWITLHRANQIVD